MSEPRESVEPTAMRVAIWHHVASIVLLLGFTVAGAMRLNDCDLFNPDSPRYLIYGQSLADTGQYRAIDTPGAPLYTWRPPGLPILLVPVLKVFPYDVVAAKWVVLVTSILLLALVHAIASSTCGGWSGPLMVAVVGTSPLFLSMGTEVLTEVPYALGTISVLYWIGCWDRSRTSLRPWFYLFALAALAFTPVIRTVGVSLVVAVGLWSLPVRRRWRFLPAVAAAVAVLGWLAWRSRLSPGNNYAGSLWQSIREQGLPAVVSDALGTLAFYAGALPGIVLPGLTSEQPFYAPMVIGTLPSLAGWETVARWLTGLVILLGLCGLWHRRSQGGLAALLYLPLYVACLAIWPWRHERFVWPLVPLLWAFVPAGCAWMGGLLPDRLSRGLRPVLILGIVAVCGWQSWSDARLISTNQRFLADRDHFYHEEAPGFYFSDWRKAGVWIRENTLPHARLLSWQAAVGGTAHRCLRRVQFEAQTPERVRQQIASFPARYLVITTAQFGTGFVWPQAFADPACRLTIVYHDRDVAVLEVSPNRTGQISRTGYADWVNTQRIALEAVLARDPNRPDLVARLADLLREQGQNIQAIKLLEDLVQQGVVTVRVCSSLGWAYFAEKHDERAAHYLDLARGLPNAEPVAASLADGARRARERLQKTTSETPLEAIDRSLRRIQSQIASLDFSSALLEVERIELQAPNHPELTYLHGYLHHLFGEFEQAEADYVRAESLGSTDARAKLQLLRLDRALRQSAGSAISIEGITEPVEPDAPAAHVHLARLLDEQGWSGRSVAVLETARQRFGDRPEILSPLAELYLRFARPEEAAPLFRRALEDWPHDKSLRQGLAAAEAALRVPRF